MAEPAAADRRRAAQLRAVTRLALEHTLAEVVTGFEQRGIPTLALKGAAFARWLYEDPAERSYRDVDLLVDPERLEPAAPALNELGFERVSTGAHPQEQVHHHSVWRRRGAIQVRLELHHTLHLGLVPAPPVLVWQRLSAGSRTLEVSGASIPVPSEACSALIVALHAAQHGGGARSPMRDLQRALERVALETWWETAALARELGATDGLATGLRLTADGRALAARLALGAWAPRHVRLMASTPPETTMGFERLVTTPGLMGRLKLVAQELAPSPDFMRIANPRAQDSRRALVAAYVMRPAWLLAKLPRGLLAWLRVASRGWGSRHSRPARR